MSKLPVDILEDAALSTGWNEESQLLVALDFILASDSSAAFQAYVENRAEEELKDSASGNMTELSQVDRFQAFRL